MLNSDKIALASAVVSVMALVATIVFALLGRKHTKEQIKQATIQFDEAKNQFLALNTPDVEIEVQCKFVPPEDRGIWLKATNHHPTITVNHLKVFVVGDSPAKKEAFTFFFLTFGELKPMQTILDRSPIMDLDSLMKLHFPTYNQSGGLFTDKAGGGSFDAFPIKVHFSFLPRLHGAQKVEGVQDLVFEVMHGKGT